MGKIVCVRQVRPHHLEQIRAAAPGWDIVHGDKEMWIGHLPEADIVMGWNKAIEELCLQPGTKLRWVQNWGAGVDKLPLSRLAEHGVALTNASGVHAFPISETIFAMLLAFSRKLHLSIRNQLDSKWSKLGASSEIHGQTMGIIGVGAIGEETARLAKAFGMKVLGVRRSGGQSPYVDRMYTNEGLDEVLQMSDVIVVTVPLTAETRYMFGARQFALMKPTAIFINIGRGGTTDTEALIEALKNGVIGCAGLDVFEQEPLPESSPLWQMDNVIVTPHNSGSTVHYEDRGMSIFLENLNHFLQSGRPGLNVVDFDKQY